MLRGEIRLHDQPVPPVGIGRGSGGDIDGRSLVRTIVIAAPQQAQRIGERDLVMSA